MKKTLVASYSVLVVLATAVSGQSSVWKVTSGAHTFYLGGTCHMLRPSDLPLPAEFDTAYAASEVLYFETDIARLQQPETQQLVMQRGTYGGTGGSLQKELSPEAWAAVESYCATSSVPIGMANQLRPWLFAVTVATVELQKLGVTNEGVDVRFHQRATRDQKETLGLETFEQHLEFIFNMGAGQENEMVLHSVEEAGEIPQMFEQVIAAWRSGDLATIDRLLADEIRQAYPKVYETLIVERNRAWLPQLKQMLATDPVEFVLVGVGHISGPDGLLAALQEHGYTVEQLRASEAPLSP